MLVGVLGTWPVTVEIEGRKGEWRIIGEWSMEEEELRRLSNNLKEDENLGLLN